MKLAKIKVFVCRYAALSLALGVIGLSARSAFATAINCSADGAEGCESIPKQFCGTIQGNYNYVMRQPYGCNGSINTGSGICFPAPDGPCCVTIRFVSCPTALPCPCPAPASPTSPDL